MLKVLAIIVAAGLAGAAGAVVVLRTAPPSTALLDADLSSVRSDIEAAQQSSAEVGGLLKLQANLRIMTLRSTEAMLDQKRISLLRGITLTYPADLPAAVVPPDELKRVEAAIAAAKAEVTAADNEAARYSGGLLLVMAKVRSATALTTIAQLNQQLALTRQGIGVPIAGGGANNGVSNPSAGRAAPGIGVTDKEAFQ